MSCTDAIIPFTCAFFIAGGIKRSLSWFWLISLFGSYILQWPIWTICSAIVAMLWRAIDRPIWMPAICYSCPISSVSTNEQTLDGKTTYAKLIKKEKRSSNYLRVSTAVNLKSVVLNKTGSKKNLLTTLTMDDYIEEGYNSQIFWNVHLKFQYVI